MRLQPEVQTDNTSDRDRELMRNVMQKPFQRKLLLYLPVILISIVGLVIINMNDVRFDLSENKRGTGNLVFVLAAALFLRLAIWEIMSYTKDVNHFQIKKAKGIIHHVKGCSFSIGNYEFNASALGLKDLHEGEVVELRAAYKSACVFWLKKIES
jgi:uncharacterized membrane-anchored protein